MPAASPSSLRRTFAIISHPDAGKTTLTEKLLLFGGAIQLAGEVKAKASRRQTRSDWMEMERERGISVVTSVMTFEYAGLVFNLLDTPGHEDFSEDTYRTLTAVDSAVMVIDAAKGIEARTKKLFEVCRLRDIPIITFINKMDREGRHPFELLEEIEKTLALDTAPLSWPLEFRPHVRRRLRSGAERRPPPGRSRRSAASRSANLDAGSVRRATCPRAEARRRRRGNCARQGRLPPVRLDCLPRGSPDAGALRLGAPQFRRPRPDRAARRHRAAAGAAPRRGAHGRVPTKPAMTGPRLQDPGEHGPEPSRPHRVPARLLGQADPRHEGEARCAPASP